MDIRTIDLQWHGSGVRFAQGKNFVLFCQMSEILCLKI